MEVSQVSLAQATIFQGLIFTVDLNDKIRVLEAWDKLHAILGDIKNLTKK